MTERVQHVPRERDERVLTVLRLYAEGLTATVIAERLRMSRSSVQGTINRIKTDDIVEGDQSWAYRRGCAL